MTFDEEQIIMSIVMMMIPLPFRMSERTREEDGIIRSE